MIDITGFSSRELSLMFANDEMLYKEISKMEDIQELLDYLLDLERGFGLKWTKEQEDELMDDFLEGVFK